MSATGYAHPDYAASLAGFGTPRYLSRAGGWILERPIPETPHRDAMGCYPLFDCADWTSLSSDLEEIGNDLVSLVVVCEPLSSHTPEILASSFPDLCIPFKQHFVVDLSSSMSSFVSSHHRRSARKALRNLEVERCLQPEEQLGDWCTLYGHLIERHGIVGVPGFSRTSFAKQLAVPGIVAFRATHEGETVGLLLWYTRGDVGYYHLSAYNETGYEMRAAFGLFWAAIEYFSKSLKWLNLGASPGRNPSPEDGLIRFKKGWSTGTRSAYLCGRIFDPKTYARVREAKQIEKTDYFPAYRNQEI